MEGLSHAVPFGPGFPFTLAEPPNVTTKNSSRFRNMGGGGGFKDDDFAIARNICTDLYPKIP